jgi:hypothetical protein
MKIGWKTRGSVSFGLVTIEGRFREPRADSGLAETPYNSRAILICNRNAFNRPTKPFIGIP